MTDAPNIVWFRNDLRLSDHPALNAAADGGRAVLGVFVFDDAVAARWPRGGASRWWLHGSLEALSQSFAQRGGQLILRQGRSIEVLRSLAAEVGAGSVYCSRGFEPWAGKLEADLHAALGEDGVQLRRYAGTLLHDPDQVRTKAGGAYKVYSPFWRALSAQPMREPLSTPTSFNGAVSKLDGSAIESDDLASWGLLPKTPDWAGGLREAWQPGEAGALERLDMFLSDRVHSYADERDRPGVEGTSRLSPHLHFGEISPAQIWHATQLKLARAELSGKGPTVFLKEVVWREFSYHLLHHFPTLPEVSFQEKFNAFPWEMDEASVVAWQKGKTGYPIVDAGMRELWATGWMHNRVRMIVASFLVKHLMIPWQVGEAWFWDCLVDADLASNSASWQWVAGSGADAAPYFRVFNPILQGKKFDTDGAYVRRWVPELQHLPDRCLHAPWEAPGLVLKEAGVELGVDYPYAIVDHQRARDRALAAYEIVRAKKDG